MRKRPKREQRGFALIIVVILVALLTLTGAALLDLVNVDIRLSSEHEKVVRAQLIADGSLREVMAASSAQASLPDFTSCGSGLAATSVCPNYRFNWAQPVGGVLMRDPDNIGGARAPLDESGSAFVKWTSTPRSAEMYTATVDLVRVVEGVPDTGVGTARAVVYEINTRAQVGRDAFHDVASETFKIIGTDPGRLVTFPHFR